MPLHHGIDRPSWVNLTRLTESDRTIACETKSAPSESRNLQ